MSLPLDDIAWTEICIWPLNSIADIGPALRDALGAVELKPRTVEEAESDDPHGFASRSATWHPFSDGQGFLRIVDETAGNGIEGYREILTQAQAAALNYHATNDDGDSYPGRFEHHCNHQTTTRRLHDGAVFVTAEDLGGDAEVAKLPDVLLADRVRRLLLELPAPPLEIAETW